MSSFSLSKLHRFQPYARRWLVLLCVFLPAIWMYQLIAEHVVDIGCWDMWENAPLLEKWQAGTLTWADLYGAQIQHRIVVPRLLIIALHSLTGGDFRSENWANFAFMLASAILIYRLLRSSLGETSVVPAVAFVANLLIFSPMLYQNVSWGALMWMSIPMPCLLGAMMLLGRDQFRWSKFIGAAILIEIASHSFSHGLAMWPLMFAVILANPALGDWKRRGVIAAVWGVIGGVTIGFYLHDFVNVAWHAYDLKVGDHALSGGFGKSLDSLDASEKLTKLLTAFWAFLGSMWSRDPFNMVEVMLIAQTVGKWIFGTFVVCFAYLIGTKRGRELWRVSLPWVALAGYVIGVGLLVGMGRTTTGEFRALTPRYCIVSLFLPVATLALVTIILKDLLSCQCLSSETKFRVKLASAAVLGVLAMAQFPSWQYGTHLMQVWQTGRLQAKGVAMFINTVEPENDNWKPLDRRDANGHLLDAKANINKLLKLGLFKTPVFTEPKLSHFTKDKKTFELGKNADLKAAVEGDALIVSGFARFRSGVPVDLVLLVDPKTDMVLHLLQPKLFQLLRLYTLDYEFTPCADLEEVDGGLFHPFKGTVPLAKLPQGEGRLEAWALNSATMQVRKLPATITLKNAPGAASAEVQYSK